MHDEEKLHRRSPEFGAHCFLPYNKRTYRSRELTAKIPVSKDFEFGYTDRLYLAGGVTCAFFNFDRTRRHFVQTARWCLRRITWADK